MKEFGEWFSNPARRVPPAPVQAPRPELDTTGAAVRKALEHLEEVLPDEVHIRYTVPCSRCGRRFEWPVEIERYDPSDRDGSLCGGSPSCCP